MEIPGPVAFASEVLGSECVLKDDKTILQQIEKMNEIWVMRGSTNVTLEEGKPCDLEHDDAFLYLQDQQDTVAVCLTLGSFCFSLYIYI